MTECDYCGSVIDRERNSGYRKMGRDEVFCSSYHMKQYYDET